MIIAVDFDGTIVDHRFPDIGPPVPGAIEWLQRWKRAGAILILWTVRDGRELWRALDFLRANKIEFDRVNENQVNLTKSRKVYADIYIDDAAYGTPLQRIPKYCRPCVNWSIVGPDIMKAILEGGRWPRPS